MKVVILAGGYGTRISEESVLKPKPMIEIGTKPILWHIMKIYSAYGINEFIICCGYKGYVIKEYFANYFLHNSSATFDIKANSVEVHDNSSEPWKVTVVDTGEHTMTGGRLKAVKKFLGDEDFCFTYGDGVADINISQLIEFHKQHKKLATVSVTAPPGRFGVVSFEGNLVSSFQEKPRHSGGYINGGFFVLNPKVIEYIKDDATVWEKEPMERLAQERNLGAFQHEGFWQPMDTLRDKNYLEDLWQSKKAPWKVW
ncbi:MAG: glucose-1-phosphate cytidylyltransferase [Bdellovibrionota bacterium]